MVEVRTHPQAKCPIRPGDPCSLCVPGASGPQDCGLVYLVMSDPDLRSLTPANPTQDSVPSDYPAAAGRSPARRKTGSDPHTSQDAT
jgi:hypothetical protein